METKTDRVKAVKPYGNQDQYGNYSYIVEFENGDNGFFKTKTDQVGTLGLVVGQPFDYTIEKKTSGAGKEYFVIAKPKTQFNGAGKQADPARQKSIEKQCALKCAVELHKDGGAIDIEQILETAKKLNTWLLGGGNGN